MLSIMPVCRHQNGSLGARHDFGPSSALTRPLLQSVQHTSTPLFPYTSGGTASATCCRVKVLPLAQLWESAGEGVVAFLLTTTISPVP